MLEDIKWLADLVAKTRSNHDVVPQAISDKMLKLLGSEISENQLSAARLISIANLMIADMAPVSSGKEPVE